MTIFNRILSILRRQPGQRLANRTRDIRPGSTFMQALANAPAAPAATPMMGDPPPHHRLRQRQRPVRKVRFMLDNSTAFFRYDITREGYEVFYVQDQTPLEVLQSIRDSDIAVLTLDQSYANFSRTSDKKPVLILPPMFLPIDENRERKREWLAQLLRSHDQIELLRMFPIRTFTARSPRHGWWRLEEVSGTFIPPPVLPPPVLPPLVLPQPVLPPPVV